MGSQDAAESGMHEWWVWGARTYCCKCGVAKDNPNRDRDFCHLENRTIEDTPERKE